MVLVVDLADAVITVVSPTETMLGLTEETVEVMYLSYS